MIKILIIDDTDSKRLHIKKILESVPELLMDNLSFASDLVGARDLLSKCFYDLLILDLYLPHSIGEKPTLDAGIAFVKELRISRSLIKPAHVIGLTAYDDALKEADPTYFDELWRLIKYDPSSDQWSKQLKSKVEYLLTAKNQMRIGDNASYNFDLGIITALWNPELKAVLDLPLNWSKRTISNDDTQYYAGVPNNRTPSIQVVAASCSQMGMASAAVLAAKMITHFRPRYLAIVGIAAGIQSSGVNLGDILIAEQSWDYESGKRKERGGESVLEPDPHHIPICSELREKFNECIGKTAYTEEIESLWKGSKPHSPLNAVLGPLGSGAAVIQDATILDTVKTHARKIIGIEMETYGVFFAAENGCKPRPKVFSVKSVVDFADSKKSDIARDYAAYTSARYLWSFASEHLVRVS